MNREDFPALQFPLPDLSLTVYSVIARRLLRKPIRATLMATEIISDSPARVTRIWLNRLAPFLGLVLVIAIFAILIGDPAHYLSPKNLRTVMAPTVIVAIGAIGMTMIIISGGNDLAVGSTISLTGVTTAVGNDAGWSVWLSIAGGIATERLKIYIYALAGLLFGLAGVMQMSRLRQGDPTVAAGVELDIIAAVVIGGGSLSGGEGTILGSMIGALIMAFLRNGCQQVGWPNYIQEIIIGSLIVFAVVIDRWRSTRMRTA